MANQDLGYVIRKFLRDLLGSRVSATLEETLTLTRNDYENRLREKDELIADYRGQLELLRGKLDEYEKVLIPLTSPLGSFFNPRKPPTLESITEAPAVGWADLQRQEEKRLLEEYEQELAKAKEK